MKLAMNLDTVTEENLQFARQIGVTHLVVSRPAYLAVDRPVYDYERLVQLRTQVEAAGLTLAAIQGLPGEWIHAIRYGLLGRDEQIENFCCTVTNVGRAGIPILGHSFHEKIWRTGRYTRGRGDVRLTSYDHALMEGAPSTAPVQVDKDELWEHYAYYITRVVPVAESVGLKLALHPDDPPLSPIAGRAYLFTDVDAFQRALDMAPSPANGLLFCQGCFTEMLGQGVFDAIRRFGGQGKVFYVHFRNVVGRLPRFREALIDEGDIDMLEAMRTWKAVGFDGPMIPDHYPRMVGDSAEAHRARAHAIGYMKALMTAVGGWEAA
jgi:mannonate dehydratase